MQRPEPRPYYDIAVIGAGVGGLTTAALLSKAGFSVCVLEKEPHAGGYLAGFRRKDFRFDTAIHWLNQCMPGGMACRIFDILGSDHPQAMPQQKIRRYKGDSFDYLLTNNPDELRDQWIREYPEDKEGIIRFFKAAKKLGHSFANFNNIFRTEETMSLPERLWNKMGMLKFAMPFIPFIGYTGDKGMQRGLDKFFKNEQLKKVFSSDSELLSCLVPIGWAYYGDYQSPPQGGGQVIPEWLEHIVTTLGNDIFYKCSVDKILTENGTATGVQFNHRGSVHTIQSKYVIAACDVETLYEKMLPASAIPEKLKNKLYNAELYSSSVTISIALDRPAEELGFGQELVHLASEHVPRGGHSDGNPHTSEISILAPSTRDKTLAPDGCGTLTLFMPAFMNYENKWQTEGNGEYKRGEAYKKLKHDIAEVIIQRVQDALSPKLREHILFYDVATPVTHWRYTGNRGGTMMGAKPGRANMQNKIAHYRTPVKNLLLGGHWAELGGGVPIAVKAGANASLLVLKKEKPAAYKLLAGYMDGKISTAEFLAADSFLPYDNSWIQMPTPAQKAKLRQQEQESKS
jgi:prolycopene isomerase